MFGDKQNRIWYRGYSKEEQKNAEIVYFRRNIQISSRIVSCNIKISADTRYKLYVISRIAGEGRDRSLEPGDYYLTKEEEKVIGGVCKLYDHVLLVINAGGLIDLSFTDKYKSIEGIIYIQQPGMEAGNAFSDIVSGKVTPSAKLTDTWANEYMDYPEAENFSDLDNNVEYEEYKEGIYVGYRYFDTYEIPVRYGFGFGLSYTEFEMKLAEFTKTGSRLTFEVDVRNVGEKYSGKEVVQLYCSAPQQSLHKEYRRLVGYAKTKVLSPGECERITVTVDISSLGSYSQEERQWIIEEGIYGFFLGNELNTCDLVCTLEAEKSMVISMHESICPLESDFREMSGKKDRCLERRADWLPECGKYPKERLKGDELVTETYVYNPSYEDMPVDVLDFVDGLSREQLILLATGNVAKGQGALIGSAGISVPGSAAETSDCAEENGLAPIVLADGPAGLRLTRKYYIKDGKILPTPITMAMEDGFLCREKSIQSEEEPEKRYQYCTAFPVGTSLAQSWDVKLMERIGAAVAEEMKEFNVTLWLAPGLNIHRNPLCGRNFEYYSEEPLVSGECASAITKGVQSVKGYGTTIKHFACNNQENNRMASDSRVGERALREIYVKGFEIAVKKSEPMSIMTSYNLINGIHAANSYDLCTKLARNEWAYKGVIMTDWTTTMNGDDCTASGCMRAGNDLVMPGCNGDHENIRHELAQGTLDIKDLKRSVARLVNTVWNSNAYEKE